METNWSHVLCFVGDRFLRQGVWRQGCTEFANWMWYSYGYQEDYRKELCFERPF